MPPKVVFFGSEPQLSNDPRKGAIALQGKAIPGLLRMIQNDELTVCLLKPHLLEDGLLRKAIVGLRERNFEAIRAKPETPSLNKMLRHYWPIRNRPYYNTTSQHIAEKMVFAMVLRNTNPKDENVVKRFRDELGKTCPAQARAIQREPGKLPFLRVEFSAEGESNEKANLENRGTNNGFHGSDHEETNSVLREMLLWFPELFTEEDLAQARVQYTELFEQIKEQDRLLAA